MTKFIMIKAFVLVLLVYLGSIVFIDEISRLIISVFSSDIDDSGILLLVTVIVGNLVPAIMIVYLIYIGIYMKTTGSLPDHLSILFSVDDGAKKYINRAGVFLTLFSTIYFVSILYKIYHTMMLIKIY